MDQSADPLPRGNTNAIRPSSPLEPPPELADDDAAAAEEKVDDGSYADDETADAVVAEGTPWVESSHTTDVLVGSAAADEELELCSPRTVEEVAAAELALTLVVATAELAKDAVVLTAQDLFLLRTSFFPSRLKPAELAIASASLGGRPKWALGYARSSMSAPSRLKPATPVRSDDAGGMPKCALG